MKGFLRHDAGIAVIVQVLSLESRMNKIYRKAVCKASILRVVTLSMYFYGSEKSI